MFYKLVFKIPWQFFLTLQGVDGTVSRALQRPSAAQLKAFDPPFLELPTPKIEILDSKSENSGQSLDDLCRCHAFYQN